MKHLEGIKKITIPFDLPNGPGPINVYLFCGSPLSLIDTGIKGKKSLKYIERGLQDTGFRLEDIERIYITHGHIDHFGMARTLHNISGADIFVHADDRQKVQIDFNEQFDRDFPLVNAYFLESGVPDSHWSEYYEAIKEMCSFYADTVDSNLHTLAHGEIVECGERKLEITHLPGHSPGTIGLYDEQEGLLFSGDHLLAEITPNPVLDLSARADNGYQSLRSYINSLELTKKLDVSLVLPGHGENIENSFYLIEQFLEHHKKRKETILDILSKAEKTRWEMSCLLFGELQTREIYLGLSEVQGHLELLKEEGKVAKRKKGQYMYYVAA